MKPAPALRPYVAAFWIWEGTGEAGVDRVLPDGCIDILFTRCRDRGPADGFVAVGTMTRYLDASQEGVLERVGVRFRPGGAAPFLPFLDVPASCLTDRHVPLEALWGREARTLEARLEDAPSTAARRGAIEKALCDRLSRASAVDGRWTYAASRIASSNRPLETIASEIGLSSRQLRRGFESTVGVGPKRLRRILRVQHALALASRPGGRHWGAIAVDAGFYDQAHLIADFREMTGVSPGLYFKNG